MLHDQIHCSKFFPRAASGVAFLKPCFKFVIFVVKFLVLIVCSSFSHMQYSWVPDRPPSPR